jgi:peptide/nickel transport system substrate-binding protein
MWRKLVAGASSLLLVVLALVSSQSVAQATSLPQLQNGGSMTIGVVGTVWYPFDPPAFSNGTTHANYFDAIFGQLFDQEPNGTMKPDLAAGYHYSNNNTDLTIKLRPGVKFSNGMPVDATEAQWNFTRDMITETSCACHPCFTDVQSVTTSGPLSVVIHLKQPNGTLITCFEGHAPNFLIPESVWKAEGSANFGLHPIGAGPFKVVTNQLNSKLVLTKNPNYFKKGVPHLNSLTFQALGSDQSAFEALQSGQIQMALGVTTPSTISQAKSAGIHVETVNATSMGALQFNTTKPPFNTLAAREAVAYAINPGPILKAAASGEGSVGEALQGPGGLFYSKTVPGFHSYNLTKAQALVKQLGGLSFQIQGGNTPAQTLEEEAISSELNAAGIKVTLVPEDLTTEIVNFEHNQWQVIMGCGGGVDPDVGGCAYPERFVTHAEYSGTMDPALTKAITEEQNTVNSQKRATYQKQVNAIIAKNAYAVPLYALNVYVLSSPKINPTHPGPGGGGAIGVTLDYSQLGYLQS